MDIYSINLSQQQVDYTIRQSKKARYVKLMIKDNSLHVVIPSYLKLNTKTITVIENFISQKSKWVLDKLSEPGEEEKSHKLIDDNRILYLGRYYELILHRVEKRKEKRVEINEAQHTISIYDTDISDPKTILTEWYKKRAKELTLSKITLYNTYSTKTIRSVRIKDLKSRWGSCSSIGGLNFNWKLVLAPENVMDYVIIHELSHLNHLNHSERFWNLVEHRCPDYRAHVDWLKKEGQKLLYVL